MAINNNSIKSTIKNKTKKSTSNEIKSNQQSIIMMMMMMMMMIIDYNLLIIKFKIFYLIILLLILLISETNCIKINEFKVPEAVERGHQALLYCNYTLNYDEELYSIKFYKNNIEFYRFVPKELIQKQSYKLIGIYVNLKASNSTHVLLSQTNLNSDGLYICEISTEGPIFSTVRSEQFMKIYVLPDKNVQIHGIMDQYNYGENISIVCKSGKSWPSLKLKWLINNQEVDERFVINYNITNNNERSTLISSKIGLNIVAKPQYFHQNIDDGILEIKCVATLILIYEYETIEYLVTGSSKIKHHHNKDWSLLPNKRQPIITGMKKNFRLDEIINLNCTTTMKNAQLKWFINYNPVNDNDLIYYNHNFNHFNYHNQNNIQILGLWLPMDKHLIQMPELQLRCIAYFYKQIKQFNSTLKIRTIQNHHKGLQRTIDSLSSSSSSSMLIVNYRFKCLMQQLLVIMLIVQFL